jgi:hypothetical protein
MYSLENKSRKLTLLDRLSLACVEGMNITINHKSKVFTVVTISIHEYLATVLGKDFYKHLIL